MLLLHQRQNHIGDLFLCFTSILLLLIRLLCFCCEHFNIKVRWFKSSHLILDHSVAPSHTLHKEDSKEEDDLDYYQKIRKGGKKSVIIQ